MGFRTVEITGPAELHVRSGSLVIEKVIWQKSEQTDVQSSVTGNRKKKDKEQSQRVFIPLEDISTITCMGANLRISTMAMAQICAHKITMTMLDEKYRPAGFLTAYEANARQSMIMRKQVHMDKDREERLWRSIVRFKISNQARALEILGLSHAHKVRGYLKHAALSQQTDYMTGANEIDAVEAVAAKVYFGQLCPDMIRREDTPMNSRLNYGYSIIRNSIIRAVVAAGLLPAFGIHHQNLYNAYNLADDLVEPFRPCVDLAAFRMDGKELQLKREERKQLASVLQFAVMAGGQKISVLQAIDKVVGEYKSYVMEERDTLNLPTVLPVEIVHQIGE